MNWISKNKDNGKDEVDDRKDKFTLAVFINVRDVLDPYFSKLFLTRLENENTSPTHIFYYLNRTFLHKNNLLDWRQQNKRKLIKSDARLHSQRLDLHDNQF